MKKVIHLMLLSLLSISCRHSLPSTVEDYIETRCDFDNGDTSIINMKSIIGEYDKVYLFYPATPITVVRDIMGIHNYRECQNPEMELLGNNIEEEYHYLIVVTNSKVVYEEEYNSRKFKIRFGHETLHKVFGRGFFDNDEFRASAYEISDSIFLVSCKNNMYILDASHLKDY